MPVSAIGRLENPVAFVGEVDHFRRDPKALQGAEKLQALGYRQVVEHLRGERGLPETIELVKIKTRQFAKRQMTWFRRQFRLDWLHCAPQAIPESVADTLLERVASRQSAEST